MANEITIAASMRCSKGSFILPVHGGTFQVTQSGTGGGTPGKVTATTGGVDVSFSGMTTPRWCYIKNLDSANFIQIGPNSGGAFRPFLNLAAGKWIIIPLDDSVTLHLKADTANCVAHVVALEA